MYKRFTIEELTKTQTHFFDHLKDIYTARQFPYFKGFLHETMKDSDRVYFFKSNRPLFRIQRMQDETYRFVDEQEKIEVYADMQEVITLHDLFKHTGKLKAIKKDNKTVLNQLMHDFQQGQWNRIHDKPYIVYDIETTFDGEGIKNQHFEMAYSIDSDEDNSEKMQYRYIDRTSMQKYCDYLLTYPGWIIGYNQIGFDNPVLIHNVWYGQAELDILNQKSLDPFLFLKKVLKRRIGLSKVAQSLISAGKTLTSWQEGEALLKEYKKTWEKKLLTKVKKYCKNDVHITLWVVLALLTQQKIYLEDKEYSFTLDDIVSWWSYAQAEKEVVSAETTKLF